MGKVICVANQKGGVGKSTTAHALGAAYLKKGKKVLFVDLDSQCNLTTTFSVAQEGVPCSWDLLTKQKRIRDVINHTPMGDIIASNRVLATADVMLSTETGKEFRIKEAIDEVKEDYDYIIIDTPPALGTLTINALTASDKVIIPAQADVYSMQGINQLNDTIQVVKKYCNNDLEVEGIVLTRYNGRTVLTQDATQIIEQTAKSMGTKLFKTKIRECIAVKEAQISNQDIFSYNEKCNASEDYKNLLKEIKF